jgi:hypothetical protein
MSSTLAAVKASERTFLPKTHTATEYKSKQMCQNVNKNYICNEPRQKQEPTILSLVHVIIIRITLILQ